MVDLQKHLKINVIDYGNSKLFTNLLVDGKYNAPRVGLIVKEQGNIESLTWTDASVISNKAKIQVILLIDYNCNISLVTSE